MLATSYIKIGIILHILFSALMITNMGIIPPDLDDVENGEEGDASSFSNKINSRFWSTRHGKVYALFLIGLVIFIIFKNTILTMIFKIGKYAYNIIFSTSVDEDIFADST